MQHFNAHLSLLFIYLLLVALLAIYFIFIFNYGNDVRQKANFLI